MKLRFAGPLAVALLSTPVLPAQEAAPPGAGCRPLLGLHRVDPAVGLPASWSIRDVRGAGRPEFEVIREADGEPVLRIISRDDAVFAYSIREPPLREDGNRLRWRWRTRTPIVGADLRKKSEDDSPLRLFVVFSDRVLNEGRFLRGGRAIFYTWGNQEPAGSRFPSHVSDQLAIWVLRDAGDATGDWHEEARDPFADYRTFFGDEPPPIRAIGLIPDTDQTEAEAIAELAAVCWGAPS